MCVCMHTYTDVYPQSCHKYHVPPQVRSHRLYRYTWLLDYNLERYNEESEPCGLIHMLKSMSHCKITQAAWAECEIWLLFIQWKCKNVRQKENIYINWRVTYLFTYPWVVNTHHDSTCTVHIEIDWSVIQDWPGASGIRIDLEGDMLIQFSHNYITVV